MLVALCLAWSTLMPLAAPHAAEAHPVAPTATVRDAKTTSPLTVEPAVDLAVTVSALALGGTMFALKDELVRDRCAPDCDESALPSLDRPWAGQYSAVAATTTDVLSVVTLTLPHALGAVDWLAGHHPEGFGGFATDTLILAETLSVGILVHQLTTFVAQRPRPFVYGERASPEQRYGANAYLSLYSGHTAHAFTMATSYSLIYSWRHPNDPYGPAVWVLTHGLAGLEGYARVMSGYHFPSDVVLGALVGSGIGIVVPWIHRSAAEEMSGPPNEPEERSGATRCSPSRSSQLQVFPLVVRGGFGLSVGVR